MANALKEAPSKREGVISKPKTEAEKLAELADITLSQVFDTQKKYMFELVTKNPERELPVINMATKRPMAHVEFKPYQNMVLTSQIVWNGKGILSDKVWNGRRMLRYYDGCESIFVDEQPKDKDTIEQLIKQTDTNKYAFRDGKFGAYGDERMLLLYLFICSWNNESPFRTRTAQGIFVPSNKDKQATLESMKLDMIEEALAYAREASETKMMIHANYLGVPMTDWDSGNELTTREIRTAYRMKAREDAKLFIDSYGDKTIETRYYIDRALQEGLIDVKTNPNVAAWKGSGSKICDISGLKSNEAIGDRLLENSQTEEGNEFTVQLRAIYN